ncbi:MAG TPA: glycosyltransferase family 2 protein [Chthoniobacter sp.]|nr:glycosyltransferase family 2 protein [Chthoniobacter sp.]
MTLSVIIVTLNRADCLRRCLECLAIQEPPPIETVVIDASSDDITARMMEAFPDVEYVRTDVGYGHMTASRNLGLLRVSGDVIAFLDDDAFAHPGWSRELLAPYEDATVGGVGGRALNRQPGEESEGMNEIGKLTSRGRITGNFAANPGALIETDHIIGCNMSWRRVILAEMGGLREDYPGTEVREETDIALRVRQLGWRIVFNPDAVVDHLGAPHAKGRRFDVRYAYYAQRNHLALLVRNFGPAAGILWRYLAASMQEAVVEFVRRVGAAVLRAGAYVCGTIAGLAAGLTLFIRTGRQPIREDAKGIEIRASLRAAEPAQPEKLTQRDPVCP